MIGQRQTSVGDRECHRQMASDGRVEEKEKVQKKELVC